MEVESGGAVVEDVGEVGVGRWTDDEGVPDADDTDMSCAVNRASRGGRLDWYVNARDIVSICDEHTQEIYRGRAHRRVVMQRIL